jgi:hypothetical protein
MATTSIKQTIEKIEDVITNNFSDQVRTVYFEKYADTQDSKNYPRLSFYYSDGTSFSSNMNSVALDFEFLDAISGRLNKNDRRKEVVSDLFQIASKFVSKLKDEGLLIEEPVSVTTFDNKYKDGLGGVSFTLIINIAKPCLAT